MTQFFLAAQGTGGGGWGFLITMIVVFAIMYLLMIRPQQKQQKKIREFQNSLAEGADVITQGGIYGTVKKVDNATGKVTLEIGKGLMITVDRRYVFSTAKDMPAK
ncbi:MAG: preprotein translocase subunit YajC [Prevotella sp.]|nr:preprotein translocase subunit YajC [Prevotella sp.]MCD8289169.1 preprotein translocase subunit YajC [Prevotella sp.]MCD8306487.1 preprotein translocase subunit YajC [Prevotella sp.]